jgi:hypothetical protein
MMTEDDMMNDAPAEKPNQTQTAPEADLSDADAAHLKWLRLAADEADGGFGVDVTGMEKDKFIQMLRQYW